LSFCETHHLAADRLARHSGARSAASEPGIQTHGTVFLDSGFAHSALLNERPGMTAAAVVNHSRFLRNYHKTRHGHACLTTGRVLFKLQHHKTGCLDRRAHIRGAMSVAPALAHDKAVAVVPFQGESQKAAGSQNAARLLQNRKQIVGAD
jgi:hypothetical protein